MNGKLFLIHWNQAEAEAHAEVLSALGWQVEMETKDGAYACQRIQASPPDVIVIYLTRLPSHGVATVAYLQAARSSKSIPVILVGGRPDQVDKVKVLMPDAVHVQPFEIGPALDQILR